MYRSLVEALDAHRLRPAAELDGAPPFVFGSDLPDGAAAIFERTNAGECVFFERGTRLCVVHRDLGESALPLTCRHFPRLAVRDARGTFVTLSHFCPTAASMLFREDVPLEVVESPRAFPPRDYDGLAVGADDLPPLLTPRMLMDLEAYSTWERHMVRRCADAVSPESVLASLALDARELGAWRPGATSLVEAIRGLTPQTIAAPPHDTLAESLRLHAGVMAAVPEDLQPQPDEAGLVDAYRARVCPTWDLFHRPLNRFLATKSFASWTAYQGRGIATIVRGLEAALALVRIEAARQCRDASRVLDEELLLEAFRGADFALNHLAVGEELASVWGVVEGN